MTTQYLLLLYGYFENQKSNNGLSKHELIEREKKVVF